MERLLGMLAVLGPLGGLLIGGGIGCSRRGVAAFAARGYLIGYVGLLVYQLWSAPQWWQHYRRYVKTPPSWKRDLPADMRELIDAETAERAVTLATPTLAAVGLIAGLALGGRRPVLRAQGLMAAAASVQIYLLWCAYNWHCRYDPRTQYFGLEKVSVLGLNALMFVAAGAAFGVGWNIIKERITP